MDGSELFNGSLFSLIVGSFTGTIGIPINKIMHSYDPPKTFNTI